MAGKALLFVNGERWEYRQAVLVQRSLGNYLLERFALVETDDGFVRISIPEDDTRSREYRDPSGVQFTEVWGKLGMWTDGDVFHWRTYAALQGDRP